MLKRAHFFLITFIFILLITAVITFFLSYSISPPREEEIPRRSRPVLASFFVEKDSTN